MKRFHRPFFALLLSLLLIGSQQAAFAHLLTHIHGRSAAATQYQDDHGSIDGAAETCTTCIAFAGVGGSAPPSAFAPDIAADASNSFIPFTDTSVSARFVVNHRARAPPAVTPL